jgi:hypothetical protein
MRAPVALALSAGPEALGIIRERGLRAEDVDIVPGAAGGPKWLVLEGLDRFLFGEFFARPRDRPLHLIGSSVGSWRTACMAMRTPRRPSTGCARATLSSDTPQSRRPPW